MIVRIPPLRNEIDLDRIDEANPGWNVELELDGSIAMSPCGTLSGARETALLLLMAQWQTQAGGKVFSSDGSWIPSERWSAAHAADKEKYMRIVPDVCVELASESESISRPFERKVWSEGTPPPGFPTDFASVYDADKP